MRRARTPDELGFNRYDRQRRARALARAPELRYFRRLQAVLLVARGFAVAEAARITGARPDAVYHWLRRYLRPRAPDSLRDAPPPGRPRVAGRITDARIVVAQHEAKARRALLTPEQRAKLELVTENIGTLLAHTYAVASDKPGRVRFIIDPEYQHLTLKERV